MAIHPTAIVSSDARIDSGVEIGPYAVIDGHVAVGPGCRIFPHVHITGYTTIGRNNDIHTGAVIGDAPQDRSFEPCVSTVAIGDHNVIRENVTIHRGTAADSTTVIGDDCYLMANSHVAHNCRVGNGVNIANNAMLGGHVQVGDNVFISGGSGCHQFIRVGRLCMVGGNGVATMDVPPFMTMVERNHIVNVNVVGLRRAGIASDDIRAIRNAHKIIYRSGKPLAAAIEQLRAIDNPCVREMVDFMTAPSKRGVIGGGTGRWSVRKRGHADTG